MPQEQIYLVDDTNLVQARSPGAAIDHVFRPRVRRLSATEAMQYAKTMTLEIAGEVAPINQQSLPLDESRE